MRYLKKRLTVVSRKTESESIKAMTIVRSRYVAKMEAKGWELFGEHEYSGNHFAVWEHILRMRKSFFEIYWNR